MSEKSSHNLSGSWLRHERAREHIANSERLIDALREKGNLVLPPEAQFKARDSRVELPPADSPSDDVAIRIGEAIYNLRAALDYAVHIISGHQDKSQFPIEDSERRFHARKTGRLPDGKTIGPSLLGVPERECDLIYAVQPCDGCDWSRRLRDISNRDKHRDFTVINATSGKPFTVEEVAALYPSPNLYPSTNVFPSPGYVNVHSKTPIDVALDDGVLVSVALQELEAEVGALLTRLEGP